MLFTWIKLKIATCNYDRQDCFRTERNNVKCVWYKHWPVEVRFVSSFWDSLKNWHGFSLIWPKMIPAQGLLNKAGWHNIGLITQQVSIGLKQYGDRAICTKHQKGGKRVLCVFFFFFHTCMIQGQCQPGDTNTFLLRNCSILLAWLFIIWFRNVITFHTVYHKVVMITLVKD